MTSHEEYSEAANVSDTFAAVAGHLVADASGELVLLHQQTGAYFGLNATGKRIWELIQSPRSVPELVSRITTEFDVPERAATDDILNVLSRLVDEGLASRSG